MHWIVCFDAIVVDVEAETEEKAKEAAGKTILAVGIERFIISVTIVSRDS